MSQASGSHREIRKLIRAFVIATDSFNKELGDDAPQASAVYHFPPVFEHPDGSCIHIGDKAEQILTQAVEESLTFLQLTSTVTYGDFNALFRTYLSKYLSESSNSKIDMKVFLDELVEAVKRGSSDLKVLVPFIGSPLQETEQSIDIGSVRVFSKDILEREYTERVRLAERDGDELAINGEEASAHYENFNWFIEVPISGVYSARLTEEHALNIATLVMNLFHLCYGADNTRDLEVTFNLPVYNDTRMLAMRADGSVETRSTMTWGSLTGLQGGFLKGFEKFYGEQLSVYAEVVALQLEHQKIYPFNQRFVDSLYWYGDAIREESPTVAIVKFITSLERLFTFDENEEISKSLRERAIVFLYHTGFISDCNVDTFTRAIKDAYDARSKVVHGVLSPTVSLKKALLMNISLICKKTLLAYASYMSKHLNHSGKEDFLKEHLKDLVSRYKFA
ncbi:HEPN domain-containing protein [Alteromonas naphthalenivorans]|jgi:hypothetical protein|uniref:Uncharacterized protein n=1 Tax=Alteromonas naphthalenivorans TaxID=715451 RepID=F5Z8D4_ALTNA|nr:HEPN domain-containing protein [Alteromonas naphthalenivorans]AEF03327.1 hypothetical protein ambt_09005 [Alteromonas naphthalenivorans]